MKSPQEVLLHQIELCKILESCEALTNETRRGAAALRKRFEVRLEEETRQS